MIRRKIVMQFITGADEDNNYRYKKKTLRNIRPELTDAQLCEFVQRYCALTAYTLAEAVVVDERVLIIEEEELIEVIPQEEPTAEFLKEEEDISEKGVTTASLQKCEAELATPKETMTLLTEPEQTQVQKSRNGAVATHKKMSPKLDSTSHLKHFNPLLKATTALSNQEPLKSKITIDKLPVIKDEKKSEIKKQSPPNSKRDSEIDKASSVEKIAGLENEVIEIVLDASQAFSVEALIELVEKSEIDMIKEKKLPLTKVQPQPTLEIQEQFTSQKEADLFTTSEFSSKKFVRPVTKKKMHPPVGKKTKPSKEK